MSAEEQVLPELQDLARTRIVAWLTDYLTELLAIESGEIDVEKTFNRYGLDSSAAVGMTGDLATWLGGKAGAR